MFTNDRSARRAKLAACASVAALSAISLGVSAPAVADPDKPVDALNTATPIKHVIIIVGENRSFDHLFATYAPRDRGERIRNLLSERIINADGTPGPEVRQGAPVPDHVRAQRRQVLQQCGPEGQEAVHHAAAARRGWRRRQSRPMPQSSGIPGGDPGLPAQDQFLFATGGTGLGFTLGPDTRITNVNALAARTVPDDGADDAVRCLHRRHDPSVLPDGPAGGLRHRRGSTYPRTTRPAVSTTCSRRLRRPTAPRHGGTPHDTGQTMAFFNMQKGDAPLFKSLADKYNMSDNYHQPVLGGTGPDSQPLGFRRPGVFQRWQRQSRDACGSEHLQSRSAVRHAQPLHAARAMVQLLRSRPSPGSARSRTICSALPYRVQTKCGPRRVLAGRQRKPRLHAKRPPAVGAGRPADARSGASVTC